MKKGPKKNLLKTQTRSRTGPQRKEKTKDSGIKIHKREKKGAMKKLGRGKWRRKGRKIGTPADPSRNIDSRERKDDERQNQLFLMTGEPTSPSKEKITQIANPLAKKNPKADS